MNILVTGGMGFIGSHTVVELHNSGYTPIIVDNLSNSDQSVLAGLKKITGQTFSFYEADCNDPLAMEKVFEENQIDGVIHFAASKAVGESVEKPLFYYQNNVGSILVLLELMKKYNCGTLIFSSSCTVYGQPDELPVTELSPKKTAESPYGNTKQICEEIIEDVAKANDTIRAVALRYFNPIGAHPTSHIGELPIGVPGNLVPFITQSAAGTRGPLTIHGDDYNTQDGTCVRDYIHVVDLAKAHVSSLQYLSGNSKSFDVFNIGTGRGNTVLEVVEAFKSVTGVPLSYTIGPRRAGDVEKVFGDVAKSKRLLGWKTELTMEDSLRDAWNWQVQLSTRSSSH
ncbi:MAG: UDP-glucose 4-epimerase GalE [Roseivirga sp.]